MPVVRDLITRLTWRVDRASILRANRAVAATRANVQGLSGSVRRNAGSFVFATRRWFLGALALTAVTRAVAGSAIRLQQFRVTLLNVTRSTERANEAFAFLTQFAARTPFAVEQVVSAFVRLQQTTSGAFRTQPMERFGRILTGLGDLASGVQTDVDNLVLGIQRAVAGRIQRLQQALKTQVSIVGDTIEITFRDRVITAERSVEGLTMALTELGEQEFGGSMARQLRTAGGALRNFVDIMQIAVFTIGEGGMLDGIFKLLNALRSWIEANKQTLRLIGALVGGPLKLLAFIIRGITATWRIWNTLILIWLGFKLVRTFAAASRALAAFAATVGIATTAWRAFVTAILAPLLILGFFEDFDGFLKGHRSVIGLLVSDWEEMDGTLGEIGRGLRTLQGDFNSWTEVVGGIMATLWAEIKAGFLELVADIVDAIAETGGAFSALIGADELGASLRRRAAAVREGGIEQAAEEGGGIGIGQAVAGLLGARFLFRRRRGIGRGAGRVGGLFRQAFGGGQGRIPEARGGLFRRAIRGRGPVPQNLTQARAQLLRFQERLLPLGAVGPETRVPRTFQAALAELQEFQQSQRAGGAGGGRGGGGRGGGLRRFARGAGRRIGGGFLSLLDLPALFAGQMIEIGEQQERVLEEARERGLLPMRPTFDPGERPTSFELGGAPLFTMHIQNLDLSGIPNPVAMEEAARKGIQEGAEIAMQDFTDELEILASKGGGTFGVG